MGTKTSNALGYYEFDSLRYDDYYIVTTSTHITDGSVNTTDAAQINSWSIAPYNIEKVRFYAGDVTGSSIFINGTDAQSILNNFVNGDPFNRLSWTFWKKGETISSNTSPTQSYPSVTLTAGGGNSTVNMYGLCTGDFNRSYNPQLSKSISTTLSLVNSGNIQVGNEQEFDLPIRTVNANRVGAVSLILNFPANVVDIQDVVMNSAYGQLNWAVNGNELRIGWYSEAALNLNASDILLTLKLKTKSTSNAGLIKFSLAANPLNELADEQNEVIDNAVLSIADVNGSATGIEEQNQTNTLSLSNQPNPFNGTTMINYSLPFDGKLKLEMYNYMGSLVKVLTNEDQLKGIHSLKFEDSSLASGIYMVTLSLKTENNEMFKTIKLVNNRYSILN